MERDAPSAARAMGLQIQIQRVSASREIDAAFATFARQPPDAGGRAQLHSRLCDWQRLHARDLQSRSTQWMLDKSLDGSAPVGPWLVTADLADGDNLKIECRVNGEVRQSSNTSDMVFNCKQLVSYISRYFTLKPGDIIFTGTPEGVIAGYPKDKQVWLKAGDKIVTSIEKLGDLTFTLT